MLKISVNNHEKKNKRVLLFLATFIQNACSKWYRKIIKILDTSSKPDNRIEDIDKFIAKRDRAEI